MFIDVVRYTVVNGQDFTPVDVTVYITAGHVTLETGKLLRSRFIIFLTFNE